MIRSSLIFLIISALCTLSACRATGRNNDGDPPSDGDADVDGDVDGDTDGDADQEAEGDAEVGCPDGRELCLGVCVDISSDPRYCGHCSRSCALGEVCIEGECLGDIDCREEPCSGLTYCNLGTGECLPGCASDDQCGAHEECAPGSHDCLCEEGYGRCEGSCVSLTSATGHPCAAGDYCDFAANACVEGCAFDSQCGSHERCDTSIHQCTCQSGFHDCDGQCLDNGAPTSCGTSCVPCPSVANGSAICVGGSCGIECDPNRRLCAGACAACPDNAVGLSCSGSQCVATSCRAGYHLCDGECFSDSDADACGAGCRVCPEPGFTGMEAACIDDQCTGACEAGTTMCHGRCLSGACSWTAHSGSNAAEIGIEVDDSDVVQVATTNNYDATHYELVGGSLVASSPGPTIECFYTDYYSYDTPPVVFASPDGTVTIACIRGNMLEASSWDGASWSYLDVQNSGSLNSLPRLLRKLGRDVLGYYWYYPDYYSGTRDLVVQRLVAGEWSRDFTYRLSQSAEDFFILDGASGSVQVAWTYADDTEVHSLSEADEVLSSAPDVAHAYALDRQGRIVGVSTALTFYRNEGGAWDNEVITSGTATDLDLVVDEMGNVHVAWVNTGGVYYGLRSEGAWSHEQVSTQQGWNPDLEVGSSGKAAIAVITSGERFSVFE